ncbi:MAG: class I SAM-dependent RNA methyltransferase [Clostridia bacterium]|nr:class I SAM-dependent RNA methyltransferase [Clostridia bacterium]
MIYDLVATCLFGLEHLLGEEIDALGLCRTETIDGRVSFRGNEEDIARANVNLRFAERVYIRMGKFHADTFDALFEGTKALPWEQWIGKNDAFPVKGHAIHSALFSLPDCQKIIKKAIVTRLSGTYGVSWFEETGTKYQVEFFILKDEASLMIDTSGVPLHKRGYRPEANEAPIRETLAAAMAAMAKPRENVLFWDPLCGSGTIAIEAALLHLRIAPGKNRSFAGEAFPGIPKGCFRRAREEAIAREIKDGFEVYASDIDPVAVRIAQDNVIRAGVKDTVKCFVRDARTISAPGRRGTVVTNPPYGERLLTVEQAETLLRELGEHFRSLSPWQIYVISPDKNFERHYGKRADKVRKLYNGMIPCGFYQYYINDKKSGEK